MDLYDIYDQIPEGNDGRDPVREVRLETDKTELFAFSRVVAHWRCRLWDSLHFLRLGLPQK